MSDSILDDIKGVLGIGEDDLAFDRDIVMHINSVFFLLNQQGVGPQETFHIKDNTSKWDEFFEGSKNFELVKSYTYLKVRLLFDPPETSYSQEALKKQADEYEWRLNIEAERRAG